ncbi:RICIN domain-containing protein [Sphingomonas oligophenolica]|uniref:Exo-alpha-sialidase n=1 Tax=Sphingomonas oligophenolica TaxID=301154 RepID=A0ABU9Y7C4_9SPHN
MRPAGPLLVRVARIVRTVLALALGCGSLSAKDLPPAPYHWANAKVGGGGFAPGIVFSQAERGLAWLRTDMGGAYRWDAVAGRWLPLQDGMAEGSYMGVESIAPDPVNPDIVYLAAGMGATSPAAILRSADRGRHWTIVPVPFRMGGNENGRGLGERLAIDPNRTATLFFGSRHDGLWRSDDSGAHWAKVAGFPAPGLGAPAARQAHGGVSFVVLDPASGAAGQGSRTLYAGVADPGAHHLFRSADGGATWQADDGARPALLPVKAAIDARGTLFVTYDDAIGPNGIADGAVWRRDGASGRWADISPPDRTSGGFMGVSVARSAPGTIAVSSIDRWNPGDTVWRSTDNGAHWTNLRDRSARDISATPFLRDEGPSTDLGGGDFGHWITGLAIDPFDAGHAAYTTGATLYATPGFGAASGLKWAPWTEGIEQTAVITLISPTGGANLISGFGDLAGFVHTDLARSPQPSFTNPYLSNTNNLDYAGQAPLIVVRSGSLYEDHPRDATLAWSGDGGMTWQPVRTPAIRLADDQPGQRYDLHGDAAIIVSADGATFIVCTPVPLVTRDHGRSWGLAQGLHRDARPVADKVDPGRFYSVDFAGNRLLASSDGARSFAPVAGKGLPADLGPGKVHWREQQYRLVASPFGAGDLWFQVGDALWHSDDGGQSFGQASGKLRVELFGLGKPVEGSRIAAIYAIGTLGTVRGVWRSLDGGREWTRINDADHQWGLRFRVIGGDPRIFGRVYIGTDGRGLMYGDPAAR